MSTGIMVPEKKRKFSIKRVGYGGLSFETEFDPEVMAFELRRIRDNQMGKYCMDAEDFVEAVFSFLHLACIEFSENDVNKLREFVHLAPIKVAPFKRRKA